MPSDKLRHIYILSHDFQNPSHGPQDTCLVCIVSVISYLGRDITQPTPTRDPGPMSAIWIPVKFSKHATIY